MKLLEKIFFKTTIWLWTWRINSKILWKRVFKIKKRLSILILEEQVFEGFDFKVLHNFIDSTVDADRLDYINSDMLASGYITGPNDHIRITKQAVLVEKKKFFI